MKSTFIIAFALNSALCAESPFQQMYQRYHESKKTGPAEQVLADHKKGSLRIAHEQDELSADVQELIQEETNEKVIDFLNQAEDLMNLVTDRLEALDTSGETIAIETEIIEKIAAAAQQKQSSDGKDPKDSALMQMLQQMMGQGAQAQQAGKQQGKGASSSGGEGKKGYSSAANPKNNGDSSENVESRRLPKKSGSSGTILPREFRKALDAYNKGHSDIK